MNSQQESIIEGAIQDNLYFYDIEDIVSRIAEALDPEELFDISVLKDWAYNNGYVHRSEIEDK